MYNVITPEKDGSVILTAPVMVPGVPDCDFNRGEPPLTKKQIREFANSYEKYQFIDHEHQLEYTGQKTGTSLESFILN